MQPAFLEASEYRKSVDVYLIVNNTLKVYGVSQFPPSPVGNGQRRTSTKMAGLLTL